jgi:hypothetical protein
MRNPKTRHGILAKAAATASAILLAGAVTMIASGQTMANPAIAQKTGQPCAKCHTAPPALNDYGKKYKEGGK